MHLATPGILPTAFGVGVVAWRPERVTQYADIVWDALEWESPRVPRSGDVRLLRVGAAVRAGAGGDAECSKVRSRSHFRQPEGPGESCRSLLHHQGRSYLGREL